MSSLCNFLNNLISARCIMLEVSHQNPTTHPRIPNTKSSYPFIPRWIQGEPRVFISGTEIKEEAEINSNVRTLSLYLWHTRLEYHTEYHLSIKTKELFPQNTRSGSTFCSIWWLLVGLILIKSSKAFNSGRIEKKTQLAKFERKQTGRVLHCIIG